MKKIIPQITYKSVLSRYKNIERRNAVFNALDSQSQRLEIAWEALQLITNNPRVKPAGRKGDSFYWSRSLSSISGDSKELQCRLVNKLPSCEVCQRGLFMLSQIRLSNGIGSDTFGKSYGTYRILKGFNENVFFKIDREYECCAYSHPYKNNTRKKQANICCNVLVNGNFNVNDNTDYLKNAK